MIYKRLCLHGAVALAVAGAAAWRVGELAGGELLPPETPIAEAIDHYIDAALAAAGVQPAAAARDEVVIRRTTLDLIGRPATAAEAREYLESNSADKREALIERLMASPSFVDHQARELDTQLMYGSGASLHGYLTSALESKRPWDVVFRELMLAETPEQSAFLKARVSDIDKLANEASVAFFGVNVSCAKCHDHPLVPEWTQDRFFGMKSFFNRTFDNGGLLGERDYGVVDFKTTAGEQRTASLMFLTGVVVDEPAAAEPTDAEKKAEKELLEQLKKDKKPPPAPKFSRRAQLADVALRDGQRQFFARAAVNQLWARLYGRGLVHPIDQMHPENLPSHPELLEWLATDFILHQYDVPRLVAGMVSSQAYARSSRWNGDDAPPGHLFAVAQVRPMSPHQYAATLKIAAANPDSLSLEHSDAAERVRRIRESSRGMAGLFEQPREDFQVSVSEALLVANGDRFEKELLRDAGDSLVGKLKAIEDSQERASALVWSVFARPPAPAELTALTVYFEPRKDNLVAACQQALWALLGSSECRFIY